MPILHSQYVKDVFEGKATINVESKFYIKDENGAWVDFSDRSEDTGINRLVQAGVVSHVAEADYAQFVTKSTTVVLHNKDGYFNRPFGMPSEEVIEPKALLTIGRAAASFSNSKNNQETNLCGRLAKVCARATISQPLGGGIASEEFTLGVFEIADMTKNLTSGTVSIQLNDLASKLKVANSAEKVKDGMSWYQNRPISLLLNELLKPYFVESGGELPGTYHIPTRVQIPIVTGDREFSIYGIAPDYDSVTNTWIRSSYITRAICPVETSGTLTEIGIDGDLIKVKIQGNYNSTVSLVAGDPFSIVGSTYNDGDYVIDSVGTYVTLENYTPITLEMPLTTAETTSGMTFGSCRIYMGCDQYIFKWNHVNGKYTKISDSGAVLTTGSYLVRKLWHNPNITGLNGEIVWGVAWPQLPEADSETTIRIFSINGNNPTPIITNQYQQNKVLPGNVQLRQGNCHTYEVIPLTWDYFWCAVGKTYLNNVSLPFVYIGENIPIPTGFRMNNPKDTCVPSGRLNSVYDGIAVSESTLEQYWGLLERIDNLSWDRNYTYDVSSAIDKSGIEMGSDKYVCVAASDRDSGGGWNPINLRVKFTFGQKGFMQFNPDAGTFGQIAFMSRKDTTDYGGMYNYYEMNVYDIGTDTREILWSIDDSSVTYTGKTITAANSYLTYGGWYIDGFPLMPTAGSHLEDGDEFYIASMCWRDFGDGSARDNPNTGMVDSWSFIHKFHSSYDLANFGNSDYFYGSYTLAGTVNDLGKTYVKTTAAPTNVHPGDKILIFKVVGATYECEYHTVRWVDLTNYNIYFDYVGSWTINHYVSSAEVIKNSGGYQNGSVVVIASTIYCSHVNTADSNNMKIDGTPSSTAQSQFNTVVDMYHRTNVGEDGLILSLFDRNKIGRPDCFWIGRMSTTSGQTSISECTGAYRSPTLLNNFSIGSIKDGNATNRSLYFVNQGTGQVLKVAPASLSVTILSEGISPVDEESSIISNIAINTVSRDGLSSDIFYASSSSSPIDVDSRGFGESVPGKSLIWTFDKYITDRIELADFTGMSTWNALVDFAIITNSIMGFDTNGDFFFIPKEGNDTIDDNYEINLDPGSETIISVEESNGYDEIFNYVQVTPSLVSDGTVDATINLKKREDNYYGPNYDEVAFAQFEVTQKDNRKKKITLKCAHTGSPFENHAMSATAKTSMGSLLRFSFMVYDSVIETVLSSTLAADATTMTVANVFGGNSSEVGIHAGYWIVMNDPDDESEIWRRIDTVNADTNVIDFLTAFGKAFSIGDSVKIYKQFYDGTTVQKSWSDEGITQISTAHAGGASVPKWTLTSRNSDWYGETYLQVDSTKDLAVGMIVSVSGTDTYHGGTPGQEEMLIREIDSEQSYLLVYRGNSPYVSFLRYYVHEDSNPVNLAFSGDAIVKAYYAPGTAYDGNIGNYDRFYTIGGTSVSLRFTKPEGNEAKHGGKYNSTGVFQKPDWTAEFIPGDRIIIDCSGQLLTTDGMSNQGSFNTDSKERYGLREYTNASSLKFASRLASKVIAKRIIYDYKYPKKEEKIKSVMLPWLQFVNTSGGPMSYTVKNRKMFPMAKDGKMKCRLKSIKHDTRTGTTDFVLKALDTY